MAERGRPSTFTQELADEILSRIASGQSLNLITKLDGMPGASTVFQWLSKNNDFADRYAHARTAQADAKFEQISEISEQVLRGEIDPHAGRVAIDAYKWQAGKLRPQVYGDRIEHVVRPGSPEQLSDADLARIAAPALLIERGASDTSAPDIRTENDEDNQ